MKLFKKKLKKLSQPEIKAINNKIAYPDAVVFCPRCGSKLEYFPIGNAVEVKCPSKNCINTQWVNQVLSKSIGDIEVALENLHTYAQSIVTGGEA